MELKNIFKMVKANRYTQDGRDELAKLQETEDVTYKTGDISQKTGLQKQPDGSWAPPKGSSAAKHQKAMEGAKKVGIVNKVPAGWKKAEGVTTTPNGYVAITNGGSRFPKEGQAKRDVKFIKQEDFEKCAATKPTTEELSTFKDIVREYKKNPNKQTEQIMNEAKSHLMKNRGMTPEQLGKIGREVMAESESKPTENDIRSEFNITREEHDMDVRESNAKIYPELQPLVKQRKAFFQKQVEAYGKLRDNPNNPKARADFVDAKNAISQIDADIDRAYKKATSEEAPGSAESKAWADRSKNERTATLVDWLDDWDKHPEEKNDAAYAAIEKELASRGVNRAGRQDAKKADNAGRNEFYRRAYESDAAPKIRQLTGDCRIRIRKEKPKLTGDTRIRVKK